jgi:HEAT repeat protein
VTRRKPITAAELETQLNQDPAYLARIAARDELFQELRQRCAAASAPVLAELRALGYQVQDIGDLVSSGSRYDSAVPVLIEWLPKVEEPSVKEEIARTLSVPWGKSAVPVLLEEFRRPSLTPGVRWAIGNALFVVAGDSVRDELVALARDPSFGDARQMVVMALGKMKTNTAAVVDVLVGLLGDEQVTGHAVIALGKLKDRRAHDAVAALETHPKAWVRAEVKKALARMDRQ